MQATDSNTYNILAINYAFQLEMEVDDDLTFDELREELLSEIQKKNQVYSKAEIEKLSEMFAYDLWEAFAYIDYHAYLDARNSNEFKPQISTVSRFLGCTEPQ